MKILELEIGVKNIEEQFKFYQDLMELEINNYEETSFDVRIGYSVVKFIKDKNATPYHIAFHIPDKQEALALNWLKERVNILMNKQDEIINFPEWNARSVYFYDRDKNILEFIARNNFNKPKSAIFNSNSIIGISEIGLATSNIKKQYKILQDKCQLEIFDGNFKNFCAIGNDAGLLITINNNLKEWFPTGDKAFSSNFKIQFENNNSFYKFQYKDDYLSFLE